MDLLIVLSFLILLGILDDIFKRVNVNTIKKEYSQYESYREILDRTGIKVHGIDGYSRWDRK